MSGETKHSHEPWTLQPTNRYGRVRLMAGENGPTIAIIEGAHPSDLLRLVACVNACAGIPTEALEAGALAKALEVTEYLVWREHSAPTPSTALGYMISDVAEALRALGRLP